MRRLPALALAALLAAPVWAAGGGGDHAEPPPEDGLDPDPPAFDTVAVPSYHAPPASIVALMRERLLAARGELPEPVSEPEAEPAHGSGH